MVHKTKLFLVIFTGLIFKECTSEDVLCCIPDQLETVFIYDNANVFMDAETAYSYINATIVASYDYRNKRAFLNISAWELTPLVPKPEAQSEIWINDFGKGVQYQVSGSQCTKNPLGPMTRQCVPKDAERLDQNGKIGGERGSKVETFTYKMPDGVFTVIPTLDVLACLPSSYLYYAASAQADSGTINSIIVANSTVGIRDPSIFNPPAACDNLVEQSEVRKQKQAQELRIRSSTLQFLKRMPSGSGKQTSTVRRVMDALKAQLKFIGF